MEEFLQKIEIWFVPLSAIVTLGTLFLYFKSILARHNEKRDHEIENKANILLDKKVRERLKEYGIFESPIPINNIDRPFNKNPEIGLIEIFEFYSSNALAFVGYHHIKSGIKPIVHNSRLSDEDNLRFLKNLANTDKEKMYFDEAKKFEQIAEWINNKLSNLQQGVLERAILDLEHGGVFYYRVSQYEYLIGICLDQIKIYQADREMRVLSKKSQEYLGLNVSWEQ